jgi:hypothetical protein
MMQSTNLLSFLRNIGSNFLFYRVFLLSLILGLPKGTDAQVSKRFGIQVYTGGPSLLKLAVGISSAYQDKVEYNGLPGVGGAISFKFNRWISLRADLYYKYSQLEMDVNDNPFYNELNDKWGIVLNGIDPFGHYSLALPRYRGNIIADFHFLKDESHSDLYCSLGFGYNRMKPKLLIDNKPVSIINEIGTLSLPFAYRLSLGYTHYFGSTIGLYGEIGVGGPLVSVGMKGRF